MLRHNIDIMEMLDKAGALLKGHFLLSSGLHSDRYLQCALLLRYPAYAEELSRRLAEKFKDERIDLVVGPAYGGIIVAHELARALGVRAIFTERKDNTMQIRRGFKIEEGERILVAEDVITTGKSVKELIGAVKPYKPEIIGIAALIDRSAEKKIFGATRTESLKKIEIKTYTQKSCPMCRKGVPLVKPGSRA